MVRKCCVLECKERNDKKGLSFFSLPTNLQMKRWWMKILSRNDYKPIEKAKICAKHFSEDCFFKERNGRRRLKFYALPTIGVYPTHSLLKEIESASTNIYNRDQPEEAMEYTPHKVNKMIQSEKVAIFSSTYSTECREATEIFSGLEKSICIIDVDTHDDGEYMLDYLAQLTGDRKVPHVFINGAYIGGISDTKELFEDGTLEKVLTSLES